MLLKLRKVYPQFTTIRLPPSTCKTPELKENVRIAGWTYTEGELHTELSDAQEAICRYYIIFSSNSTDGTKPEKLQCSKSRDLQVIECNPTTDAEIKIQMQFCVVGPGTINASHGHSGGSMINNDGLLYGVTVWGSKKSVKLQSPSWMFASTKNG
ncbi:unnamed protein product [Coregonus sp. 'balchen']|nr:unnamed protein product [Coregonus sp. 'balchen']